VAKIVFIIGTLLSISEKDMERSAIREKIQKEKELKEEKLQRVEALRKSKEYILANLDKQLSTYNENSSSPAQSCPSPTTSTSSSPRRSPRIKRFLFLTECNRKGYPTVPAKQPRTHFAPIVNTHQSSPVQNLINLATVSLIHVSLFCKRCDHLEKENQELKRHLEELRKNIGKQTSRFYTF
jgi:hypothetical protein